MSSVSIRDLTVAFGSTRVLNGLSLEVQPGELIVLLGPSGCGKSTLLNATAGLIDVEEGQIWIGNRNVTWHEPKDRGIAMVFQSYALYPRMNVHNNMAFGLRMAKTPKAEIDKRVKHAAELLQISHLLERRPDQLSGGQRQRVAIGRALVRDAQVFLFDEPLSNLDAQLRNELRVEIKRLHQKIDETTMIYVTHDQIEALTLADRIAVMKDQKIQQLGTPEEIYLFPANLFVAGFVGSPQMNFIEGQITGGTGGPAFRAGELHLPLDRYRFAGTPVPGQPATLGVRPEHLSIEEGGLWNGFNTDLVETHGADNILWASGNGMSLRLRLPGDKKISLGTPLALSPDSSRISLFDTQTSMRI
jgi:multiple sugar transport system ATP-binding protein